MKLWTYIFLEGGIVQDVRVFTNLAKAENYRDAQMKAYGIKLEDFEREGHENYDFLIEEVELPGHWIELICECKSKEFEDIPSGEHSEAWECKRCGSSYFLQFSKVERDNS